jgi:hypothetical protein
MKGQADTEVLFFSRLLDHVCPALSARGDTQTITGLLRQLDDRGTGADRQRALLAAAGSAAGFVDALARATLPGGELACSRQPKARSTPPPGTRPPGPAPAIPLAGALAPGQTPMADRRPMLA